MTAVQALVGRKDEQQEVCTQDCLGQCVMRFMSGWTTTTTDREEALRKMLGGTSVSIIVAVAVAVHSYLYQLSCISTPSPAAKWTPRNATALVGVRSCQLASEQPLQTPVAAAKWIDRAAAAMRPYLHMMRVDKPIGTLLLFYPCGS
jgi:hypothetical protein